MRIVAIVATAGVWLAAAIVVSARGPQSAPLQNTAPQAAPPAAASSGQSVLDGVFTDDQAKRGEDVYTANCAHCHGKQLEGGEEAPTLAGAKFISSWKGSSVGDLVDRARRTMPEDDPASLTLQQYTDVIAYVLQQNHYPSGKTELPIEAEKQKLIKLVGAGRPADAQADASTMEIVVPAGRALRVALDRTVTVQDLGQPVSGTLVDDVYSYDRIVLAAGSPVVGHINEIDPTSRGSRIRAMLTGNFSPSRRVVLRFDTVFTEDGRSIPVRTLVTGSAQSVRRQTATRDAAPSQPGLVASGTQKVGEAVSAAKQQARDALATIAGPDKMERLKVAVVSHLPYHPQFLRKGTVYSAELETPLSFGRVTPVPRAAAGTSPAPDSVLSARLVTALDSAKTPRGTAVEAILTEPVFSAAHELVLPEGTRIAGEVTLAKPARRWHRNGQLRFLVERVQAPGEDSAPLLGSLNAVDVSQDDRVAIDDEGGARVTNSKTRFVAPVLAVLALRGSGGHEHHKDTDGDPYDLGTAAAPTSGNLGSQSVGGFFGFGLVGVGLSLVSRPVGVAFAAVGAVRTIFRNIVGKGRELSFPADTPIQIRLAPGKPPDP
jgi:mono/diheme cytochrome c family protein